MADFSTPTSITTPGSAVADTLQTILANKRATDRQSMLDNLNSQNVQSEIQARGDQADTNRMYRESYAAQRDSLAKEEQQKAVNAKLGMMSMGQPLAPQDSDFIKQNAPSMLVPGQAAQPFMTNPDDSGPGAPPTPDTFYGSPKERDAQKHTDLQTALAKRMGDPTSGWDGSPDAAKELEYFNATGRSIPDNVLRPKVGGKVFAFDDATGSLTDPVTHKPVAINSVGPSDRIEHVPVRQRDPNARVNYTPFTGKAEDDSDVPLGYNPSNNSYEAAKVPSGVRIMSGTKGNALPKTNEKPALVPPKAWDEFLAGKIALSDPNKASNPATETLATTAAQHVIANATKDPAVQALLSTVWNKRNAAGVFDARNKNAAFLLSKLNSSSHPLNDAQRAEFTKIWNQLQLSAPAGQ